MEAGPSSTGSRDFSGSFFTPYRALMFGMYDLDMCVYVYQQKQSAYEITCIITIPVLFSHQDHRCRRVRLLAESCG